MATGIRQFIKNYHDSHLARYAAGPRREVSLEIALDPIWNNGACGGPCATRSDRKLQIGQAFLARLPPSPSPDAYIAEILRLEFKAARPYAVVLHLDQLGIIEIESTHLQET
jgi:hypothetical protein